MVFEPLGEPRQPLADVAPIAAQPQGGGRYARQMILAQALENTGRVLEQGRAVLDLFGGLV